MRLKEMDVITLSKVKLELFYHHKADWGRALL